MKIELKDLYTLIGAEQRREVVLLDALMREIEAKPKVDPAVRIVAARHVGKKGFSFDNLRRRYFEWVKADGCLSTLINHNTCGGCGLPGCAGKRESALSQEIVDEWFFLAGTNDKRAKLGAWRLLITKLAHGDVLRGVLPDGRSGTWRDLWLHLHPLRNDVPAHCPWSIHRPPPGWSRSNFNERQPSPAVYQAMQKGLSVAAQHLPEVHFQFKNLRPLEIVVIDDHRLDFKVFYNGQVVELWGVFAMDVATRRIISFILIPRVVREDGTSEGISRRSVQHLIAGTIQKFGFPRHWKMTWLVENAAAAVTTDTEQLIGRLSHGQIVFRRTGVHCSDVMLRGFPEKWGNPKGKSMMESSFNPLDIALGWVKGQTGSSYQVKPGDQDARLAQGKKMALIVQSLSEHEREMIRGGLPFEHVTDAMKLIEAAVRTLNNREEHDIRDFEQVRVWHWGNGETWFHCDPRLMGADDKKQYAALMKMPEEARDAFLAVNSKLRVESPAERWARLYQAEDYHAITPEVFADLYLDNVSAEYKGGDVLDVEIKRAAKKKLLIRYRGAEHALQPGCKVMCRLDADRPEAGVWLQDDKGRYLGRMGYDGAMSDSQRLHADLGARQSAQARLIADVRKITNTDERLRERIADTERTMEVIAAAVPPVLEKAPQEESSVRLVEAMTRPQRGRPEHVVKHELPEEGEEEEAFSFEKE